ncbi:gelsolin domain containing protein [Sporothrix brasiliensis 5110]|uniref:Gelsolin domain containing protein n=1 Tax=Sporothrix brasiliensis 5110 TaxID=1398154 RepID=A0A0C2FHL4_9PEZI|nr:gelsolin domain containing protein [Sporothrix brasiliensis 5110]KIH90573.1 gelsolin domain containing protein [Sporothrix brasiliensis 5110]
MSDEVSNFLRSVEQLKDRRLEEDEARSRELEERILQDKRERQARRAERARSISPQKSSPANTPPPPSSHHRYNSSQTSDALKLSSSPPVLGSPRSPTPRASQQQSNGHGVSSSSAALASALDYSAPSSSGSFVASSSPTKENESPFDADAKTLAGSTIARTPTLSWQQRRPPSSGQAGPDRSSRSRPLSVVAAENAAARSTIAGSSSLHAAGGNPPVSPEAQNTDTNASDAPISRDQIAQALSAKDPSWFRQTADRGANSAAYRRSQVEDEDRQDLHAASARLPGLSRGPSAEPDASGFSPPPPAHSAAVSALSPSLQASIARKTSPSLPWTPTQKLDPPQEPSIVSPRDSIVSPPSGRTSPIRPLSPTKGAGGFVQSAMMKRSDSVKRWSVTSPPGLQRADSIASSRAALDGPRRSATTAQTRPTSRPTSSHGRDSANNSRPSTPTRLQTSFPDEATKETTTAEEDKKVTPPSSPSKTMDPRRWSPTKTSSWLDAALNKPESPKPKAAPPLNNQPAWMVELNKAKANKASNPGAADATVTPPPVVRKHEVKTGGLLRSGPMGTGAANATPSPAAAPLGGRSGLGISLHTPSSSISSVTNKPSLSKEGAPPKGDLRAALKPRQPLPSEKKDKDAGSNDGSELKNVVGALRRTKTQNYVAPNVLKDNITRGKAGLNVTGGPKPREKKDELKDAIMQKKADFNQAKSEGRGIATNAHARDSNEPVPEGVAKRLVLNKTGGSQTSTTRRDSSPSKAAADAAARSVAASLAAAASSEAPGSFSRSSTASTLSGSGTTEVPETTTDTSPPVKNFGSIGRAGPRIGGLGSPGGGSGIGGGSALANRFNPALAGILARGHPGMSSAGSSPSDDAAGTSPTSGRVTSPPASSSTTDPPPGPGPQLTHMTKNRARGPRRKAPSSLQQPSTPSHSASIPAEETPETRAVTTPTKVPPPTTPKKADIVVPQVITLVDSSSKKTAPEPAQKPASVRGSPVISLTDSSKAKAAAEDGPTPSRANVISLVDSSKKSPSPASFGSFGTPAKIHEQVASVAARHGSSQPFKPAVGNKPVVESKPAAFEKTATEEQAPAVSQPSSPRKIDVKRMSKFLEDSANRPPAVSQPVEVPRPLSPSKTGGARPLPVPRPLSPQKTGGSARPLPVAPVSPKKNEWQPTSPATGGGLTSPASVSSGTLRRSKVFGDAPVLAASSSPQQPATTPSSSMRIESQGSAPASPALPSPMRSPTKQAQEVTVVLNEFFGADRPSRTYRVDTADILANRPQIDVKIKTLSAQLYRLGSDGKKQPVPAHLERILFEREMYLCPHTFTRSAGRKVTEVYFWVGDDVPAASVQDVQVFLNREARAVGGTLVPLQQGKETAEFLLALGGIVTVRRGSSNTYDSLAPSMFCGRQYLGQIAFDEVDFEPASLCSGFPYLITRQGKCYLWKGKGSNVNELSCARLIGMDLALMGELAEVEDGKESANFWALFQGSGRGKPGSADHWRLKPKYDRYARRLFRSDAAHPQQIVEIHPFDQRDLVPDGIYVLDAFFEMYIVVGRQSAAQYAAFRNALDFAQEYAILAAGMEDRPFVPISTVVLEGIPRDLKSVFRKWSDDLSPTRMANTASAGVTSPSASTSMKRGRSLRIVPLTVALQAVAE